MKILLPNEIANKYTLNSVLFKKNTKDRLIRFIRVDSIRYVGFKKSKTHTEFKGKVFKIKKNG